MIKNLKKSIFVTCFAIWAVVCLGIVSVMHSSHVVSFLPHVGLIQTSNSKGWSMTHVLSVDCKCSETVAKYLIERKAQIGTSETIILLGKSPELIKKFLASGFMAEERDPNLLKDDEFSVGVPFLIITKPGSDIVYAGGYGDRKIIQGSPIQDLAIFASLQGGRAPASFPIFGCAASSRFQKLIDPFKTKYAGDVK